MRTSLRVPLASVGLALGLFVNDAAAAGSLIISEYRLTGQRLRRRIHRDLQRQRRGSHGRRYFWHRLRDRRVRWRRAVHDPEWHGHSGPRALPLREQRGYSLATYPAGNGTTATGDATYTRNHDGEDPMAPAGPTAAAPGHRALQQQHRRRQLHPREPVRRGRPGRRGEHALQGGHRPSRPDAVLHQLFLGPRRVRQGRRRSTLLGACTDQHAQGHRQQRRGFLLRRHQRHVGRRRTASGRARAGESLASPIQRNSTITPCPPRRHRRGEQPTEPRARLHQRSREQLDVRHALDPPDGSSTTRAPPSRDCASGSSTSTPSLRRPASPTCERGPRLRSWSRASTTLRRARRPAHPRRRPARSRSRARRSSSRRGHSRTAAASTAAWAPARSRSGTPLANGASIDLQFLVGIQQTGNFRIYLNIEALP